MGNPDVAMFVVVVQVTKETLRLSLAFSRRSNLYLLKANQFILPQLAQFVEIVAFFIFLVLCLDVLFFFLTCMSVFWWWPTRQLNFDFSRVRSLAAAHNSEIKVAKSSCDRVFLCVLFELVALFACVLRSHPEIEVQMERIVEEGDRKKARNFVRNSNRGTLEELCVRKLNELRSGRRSCADRGRP